MLNVALALLLVGAAALIAGAALIYLPAALIVAGLLALTGARTIIARSKPIEAKQ